MGVVKGEGVATAKKASPFPLKKKEKNFCDKSFLNSFFKGQGKLKFESQNSFPYPLKIPTPSQFGIFIFTPNFRQKLLRVFCCENFIKAFQGCQAIA
ncbi:hypothetical protein [Campylobacter porcelli]|uniref:hypothetical protein n=1 Tax=Campylobacter porcelli TaxID=1660073 RepID=UPI000A340765|nr:hypothetical protein [Campylobacter sp. P0078]